jgi:hypothetical protein
MYRGGTTCKLALAPPPHGKAIPLSLRTKCTEAVPLANLARGPEKEGIRSQPLLPFGTPPPYLSGFIRGCQKRSGQKKREGCIASLSETNSVSPEGLFRRSARNPKRFALSKRKEFATLGCEVCHRFRIPAGSLRLYSTLLYSTLLYSTLLYPLGLLFLFLRSLRFAHNLRSSRFPNREPAKTKQVNDGCDPQEALARLLAEAKRLGCILPRRGSVKEETKGVSSLSLLCFTSPSGPTGSCGSPGGRRSATGARRAGRA